MSVDLSTMTDAELLSLKKEIVSTIKKRDKQRERDIRKAEREALKLAKKEAEAKKKEAKRILLDKAKELGVDISELMADGDTGKISKPRGKVAAKYANPANNSETWTGRGRQPKWVEAAIKEGKTLEEMAI